MEDINVHVDSYDEISHALTVYFSATVDGKEYTTVPLSYDVVNFNSPHKDEIIKELAKHGKAHIDIAIAKENHARDTIKIGNLNQLANTVHKINLQELFPRQSPSMPDWVPPVDPSQEVDL
jgi:hypothetical protein